MNKKLKNTNEDVKSSDDYPLNQLYFYLTEGCNLACRHCWLTPKYDPDGDKQPVIPLELFKQAINEAMGLGLTEVKLTGGEPLLHPDFSAMLDFLKQKELRVVIETNGLLCTAETAEKISRANNPFVSVSLDGANAETHDKIRGVTGVFQKATAAVRHLAESGIKPQVIMSVMQGNVDQIEAVIQLAEKLGADSLKFNIIQPTGRGEAIRHDDNGLEVTDLIKLGRKIESQLAAQTSLQLFFDYPTAFRSLKHIASGDGCGTCGILSILGVLPSGEYALCGIGSHIKELVFGKVGENALADIWQGNSTLHQLRSGLPGKLTGVCSHCLMKHICLGSCLAQNYYRTDSLWAPFWFCEQAEAAGLFPDSRLDFTLNKR